MGHICQLWRSKLFILYLTVFITKNKIFILIDYVYYYQLSERQKLFAQKSPLNCSQVMYGGSSARSKLSKILGSTPPIHRKAVIPISSTNNNEIRTTSSILLGHISTKVSKINNNIRKYRNVKNNCIF